MSDFEVRAFVTDVCVAAHTATRLEAVKMIRAVLRTIADCLPGPLANDLAFGLPASLAVILRSDAWKDGEPLTSAEFEQRVALREHSTPAIAREHAAVVIAQLAKVLPEDILSRLNVRLPAGYGASLSLAKQVSGVGSSANS